MFRIAVPVFALAALAGGCAKPMQDFTSPEYKFKAKFPGKPTQEQKPGPFGVQMTVFSTKARDGAYMIGLGDMPIPDGESSEAIQGRLDGARDGAVANTNASLQSSSAVTLQGKYPGREFTAKLPGPPQGPPDGIIRARVYLAGKRLYQVMVVGTTGYANSAQSTEFLNSFALTE